MSRLTVRHRSLFPPSLCCVCVHLLVLCMDRQKERSVAVCHSVSAKLCCVMNTVKLLMKRYWTSDCTKVLRQ